MSEWPMNESEEAENAKPKAALSALAHD